MTSGSERESRTATEFMRDKGDVFNTFHASNCLVCFSFSSNFFSLRYYNGRFSSRLSTINLGLNTSAFVTGFHVTRTPCEEFCWKMMTPPSPSFPLFLVIIFFHPLDVFDGPNRGRESYRLCSRGELISFLLHTSAGSWNFFFFLTIEMTEKLFDGTRLELMLISSYLRKKTKVCL